MRRILKSMTDCSADQRGSLTIIFGLMSLVLVGVMGAAVDYAKWHDAFVRTQASMDSALLAAGRQLQTDPKHPDQAIVVASIYFDNVLKSGVAVDDVHAEFTLVSNGMGIEGKVSGTVKTPFLSILNWPKLPVNSTQNVAFNVGGGSGSDIEIALMLDVTGSMCANGQGPCTSSPKMDALKLAAKDLVNIAVRDGVNSRASIVPFSTRVRIAEDNSPDAGPMMQKLTNLHPDWTGWQNMCTSSSGGGGSEDGGNWTCNSSVPEHEVKWKIMPCVTDRTGPDQFTDAAPGFRAWLNAHAGNRFPLSQDSEENPYPQHYGERPQDAADQWNYVPDADCADILSTNVVVPLTNDVTTLTNRIDALEAYGSTAGALGTAWTWYTLSPNWSGIFKAASAPRPYGDLSVINANGKPKLRKVAVLMSDGDYNTYRSWKDQNGQDVSNNAKAICTNMKAQGIEIFAVGFDLDSLPPSKRAIAEDTLKSCGTDLDHFYNSLTPAQLQTAFRDIALKMSQLYVAK
jgi:Putative Flp pilus-assembly TadE/G-like